MKIVNKQMIEYFQYFILLVVLFISSSVFLNLSQSIYKFYVVLITAIFYVVWGIWHHKHMDRLDRLIIIEYILVALIVISLSAMGLGIVRFI